MSIRTRLVLVGLLASCAGPRDRHLTYPEVDRYAAVCYTASPIAILAAAEEIVESRGYQVTHRVQPPGLLVARHGEWLVWFRLDPEATCSRVEISGYYPQDPHQSAYFDANHQTREQLYPLLRRRLATVADVPADVLPRR